MATMIVRIENSANIRNIATAMRQIKGVTEVKVQKEADFERIPGLPYTQEALIESVMKSTDEYRKGAACITQEEAKREAASW